MIITLTTKKICWISIRAESCVMNADTIWDTGSIVSVMSDRLAAELRLEPSGITKISGIENRPFDANTYLVDMELPNGVLVNYTTVVENPLVSFEIKI